MIYRIRTNIYKVIQHYIKVATLPIFPLYIYLWRNLYIEIIDHYLFGKSSYIIIFQHSIEHIIVR